MIGYYRKAQKIIDSDEHGESVWISGHQFAANTKELEENGFILIIACMPTEIRYDETKPMKQVRFPIEDRQDFDIKPYFQPSLQLIDVGRKSGKVLIHSEAGISRAGTILISYLIQKYGYSYEKSYNLIREQRPCVQPNDNFIKQLIWFQKFVNGYI